MNVVKIFVILACVVFTFTIYSLATTQKVDAPSRDSTIVYVTKDGTQTCPWIFEKYEMSEYEKMWYDHREEWGKHPCSRYKEDDNEKKSNYWYDFASAHQMVAPTKLPDSSIFSYFTYTRSCNKETVKVPIEPLALAMRSPKFCAGGDVVDKSHIYPDWDMVQQRKDTSGKVYFFDMGASSFRAGSGGASQSWFVEILEKRGFTIDGIFAWEYQKHDPTAIFNDIPEHLYHVYHWYNVGVNAEKGSGYNPWTILKRVATKDDLVVVKLDIDTPGIEMALVQQILEQPEVAALIDVFFYEDHIDIDEMNPYFGSNVVQNFKGSMELFASLRNAGVRAHPWV